VTEFRLLRYLLANAGMAVPLRVILRQVRGYDDS
jgi:DNA-binding response OmpR family regulator